MNNYPQSMYPNLYEEILLDYNFRYGKFNPINYPLVEHSQQLKKLKPKPIFPPNQQ